MEKGNRVVTSSRRNRWVMIKTCIVNFTTPACNFVELAHIFGENSEYEV
jgi:hypothetical protein